MNSWRHLKITKSRRIEFEISNLKFKNMSLAVDEPILNNPFEEPKGYWVYEEGQSRKLPRRGEGKD